MVDRNRVYNLANLPCFPCTYKEKLAGGPSLWPMLSITVDEHRGGYGLIRVCWLVGWLFFCSQNSTTTP